MTSLLDLVRARRAELHAAEPKPRRYSDEERATMLLKVVGYELHLDRQADREGLRIFAREKCPPGIAPLRDEAT